MACVPGPGSGVVFDLLPSPSPVGRGAAIEYTIFRSHASSSAFSPPSWPPKRAPRRGRVVWGPIAKHGHYEQQKTGEKGGSAKYDTRQRTAGRNSPRADERQERAVADESGRNRSGKEVCDLDQAARRYSSVSRNKLPICPPSSTGLMGS